MSLRRSSTITIVVVMLSSTADRKNVNMQSTHSSERFLRVVMLSVRTVNPPCTSTSSTIVMAPIRKKRVCVMSPRLSTILMSRM